MAERDSRELDVLAGASLGLLTGVLLGLSVSEIVGTVIGGLVALLGAFFGLGGEEVAGRNVTLRATRTGSFALGAVIGIVGGLLARTNDVLAPSPADRVRVWQEAGYPTESARGIVAFERLGLVPEGWTTTDSTKDATRQRMLALFANRAEGRCDDLSARTLPETAERLNGFRMAGNAWAEVAKAVEGAQLSMQSSILEAAWRLVCED